MPAGMNLLQRMIYHVHWLPIVMQSGGELSVIKPFA